MNVLNVLQILFDAVFLFGILFLFNFSISQTRKRNDDLDLLKTAHNQETKEQLQELLLTLKQLGNEVSENVQKEVRIAEEKTDEMQRLMRKVQREIERTSQSSHILKAEKNRLGERTYAEVPKLNKSSTFKNKSLKNKKENLGSPGGEPSKINKTSMLGLSSKIVQEVYRLADAENDSKMICEKTQLSLAEIQLILNLRGNRFTTPN